MENCLKLTCFFAYFGRRKSPKIVAYSTKKKPKTQSPNPGLFYAFASTVFFKNEKIDASLKLPSTSIALSRGRKELAASALLLVEWPKCVLSVSCALAKISKSVLPAIYLSGCVFHFFALCHLSAHFLFSSFYLSVLQRSLTK